MPLLRRGTIRSLRAITAGEVDADVVGDDPVLLAVLEVLVEVGGVEERLRGDAAAQEAGAAAPAGSRSTTAVLSPIWAARIAAT